MRQDLFLYSKLRKKNIFLEKEMRQLHQKLKRLEEMAITDGLTNLLNHRAFQEILEREFARSRRYHTHLSLALIDLDRFKCINDIYGHQEGDAVLREFSELLRSSVRETDMAARYGGEEFATILPQTPIDRAFNMAERLRQKVEAHSLFRSNSIKITISIGVSDISHPGATDKNNLIRIADEALYLAKRKGGNRVCGLHNSQ